MTYCMVMLAVEIKGLTCKGFQTGSIAAGANLGPICSFAISFQSDWEEIQRA